MKLNKNSNLSKIYRWFYNQYNMPSNLCLYFWKLVFMFVFILPSAILSLPYIVYKKFGRNSHDLLFGLFGWVLLWLVFCVLTALSSLFIHYEEHPLILSISVIGWVATAVFSLAGLAVFFVNLRDEYIEKRAWGYQEEKRPNIISEFIKAKRNKYCPQITWEDELKPQTKTN